MKKSGRSIRISASERTRNVVQPSVAFPARIFEASLFRSGRAMGRADRRLAQGGRRRRASAGGEDERERAAVHARSRRFRGE
jgi:hypothetical protein